MPEGQQLTEEDLKNMSPEQLAELQKQNCLFCHLAADKIPSKKVFEDDMCFAILDINPASRGHMLLIPKEHYVMFPQTPENMIEHLARIVKLLSRTAIAALGAEGTNIFVANGAEAGQKAPHVIIHIIPRYEGDGIGCFELPEKQMDLKETQNLLAQKFGTSLAHKEKQLEEVDLQDIEKVVK